MMANEEKMEQKQEGRKHNLKVFVIMIPLLIVSLLGLIVFSRENFKESVKEYFAVKYLESNEKLVFRNKNRNKYCSYKLDKNGNIKVKVKFDKLYKDEYANRIDLCVKFKPNSERYKMDLTDYPGKIYSYHTMFTKANEFYIKIYGIDYNPTEQEKLKAGTYTINVTGDVEKNYGNIHWKKIGQDFIFRHIFIWHMKLMNSTDFQILWMTNLIIGVNWYSFQQRQGS